MIAFEKIDKNVCSIV